MNRIRANFGQAAVLMVLFLTVLIGMLAAVLDVGGWMRTDRKLQGTVDAAALAAAQELPYTFRPRHGEGAAYGNKNGATYRPEYLIRDQVHPERHGRGAGTKRRPVSSPASSGSTRSTSTDGEGPSGVARRRGTRRRSRWTSSTRCSSARRPVLRAADAARPREDGTGRVSASSTSTDSHGGTSASRPWPTGSCTATRGRCRWTPTTTIRDPVQRVAGHGHAHPTGSGASFSFRSTRH